MELWFDWSQPRYHEDYADRLPVVKFLKASNQLRLPVEVLSLTPTLADQQANRQAIEQCEMEISLWGGRDTNITKRVRAELVLAPYRGYPSQEEIAKRLNMSSRTLARQLQRDGSTFRLLVEEARQREA